MGLLKALWDEACIPLARITLVLVLVVGVFAFGREWGRFEVVYETEIRMEARCKAEADFAEMESVMFCAAIVGPLEEEIAHYKSSLSNCNSVKDATYQTCRRVWGVSALENGRSPKAAIGGGDE